MTLLTPSTYSSRQTTHSTCLPINFFHSAEKPLAPFSCSGRPPLDEGPAGAAMDGLAKKFSLSSPPVVVRDLGRGLAMLCWSRGVGEN